jgi:putative endonuclease
VFSAPGAMMERSAYVYILASECYGTLYVGVTSNLVKRVWQHREGLADGFTKTYAVKRLVWYECHAEMLAAITREKHLKKWNRAWKIALIQKTNPMWRDLYEDFTA